MKTLLKLITFILIFTSCVSEKNKIEFKDIKFPYRTVSPTINSIQKLSGTDKEMAISDLLKKGYKQEFPLIEKDSLYSDYVFATLLYVDTTHRHEIKFEVSGIYEEYRFGNQKLYRIDSTDVYYRTYMIPDDLCFSYRFILTDTITGEKQKVTDPLNNNLIPVGKRENYSWSVLDLRKDEIDWYTKRYEDTGSRLDTFKITSSFMNNTRNIYVYLPFGYDDENKKYPVIYLFDSFIYLNRVEVPNVLDNMIKEGKIEPMIAVMIDNPTSTSRKYELPLNPTFKNFMVQELVPQIRDKYTVTGKPEETIVGGMSYGGLAASYMGFECDSIFGKVLSQSGSFWRDLQVDDCNGSDYRGDWLINKYLTEENRNLKLFLDWGLQEDWCLSSGRRMVEVLHKKGYEYEFVEFNGWHDWSNSRKTFPVGLVYLMGK